MIEALELLRRVREYGGIEPQLDCEIDAALSDKRLQTSDFAERLDELVAEAEAKDALIWRAIRNRLIQAQLLVNSLCCDGERRNMNGGCDNCGAPCL